MHQNNLVCLSLHAGGNTQPQPHLGRHLVEAFTHLSPYVLSGHTWSARQHHAGSKMQTLRVCLVYSLDLVLQFFKDKGIKVVTVYPPATYTPMTTDREDMEPVPEKEAQPSDIAKAAMLVRWHVPVLLLCMLPPNCAVSAAQ